MRIKTVTAATVLAGLTGVGALAATPASAAEPVRNPHPVVTHDNHKVQENHRHLVALCRQQHRPHHVFLVRVDSRGQLRYIEHRFDLTCRVLRFV